jgi:hypothetical protein
MPWKNSLSMPAEVERSAIALNSSSALRVEWIAVPSSSVGVSTLARLSPKAPSAVLPAVPNPVIAAIDVVLSRVSRRARSASVRLNPASSSRAVILSSSSASIAVSCQVRG